MNLKKYNQCFITTFNVSEENLKSDFIFGKTDGWDSLAHMELISALEDMFEIMFETDDILHFGSYENGKNILSKYGIEI